MNRIIDALAQARDSIATRPHRLIGLSLLRVGLGFAACITLLGDWSYRRDLYGSHGLLGANLAKHGESPLGFSVFSLGRSGTSFDLIYVSAIVVAVAFTLCGGRFLSVLQLLFVSSLHRQNPFILDGGDNVAAIILLCLPFTVTSAYFSFLSERTKRRLERVRSEAVIVHNVVAAMIVVQVCVVYLVASMWKISGPDWQHGVAMERISRVPQYGLIGGSRALLSVPLVAVLLTWSVIGVQVAVPLTVAVRSKALPFVVLAVLLMHLGIVVQLGLVSFGITMMACDCSLLGDEHYAAVRRVTRELARRRWRDRNVSRDAIHADS